MLTLANGEEQFALVPTSDAHDVSVWDAELQATAMNLVTGQALSFTPRLDQGWQAVRGRGRRREADALHHQGARGRHRPGCTPDRAAARRLQPQRFRPPRAPCRTTTWRSSGTALRIGWGRATHLARLADRSVIPRSHRHDRRRRPNGHSAGGKIRAAAVAPRAPPPRLSYALPPPPTHRAGPSH